MKVAFVHDWLLGVAGGEKVLEALTQLREGPIYTLLYNRSAMEKTSFSRKQIHTSFLQNLPKVQAYYRNLLPLFPRAIEQFDLSEYDLIFSSSHAVAKGVITHKNQIHICYCHTPMRYAWDLQEFHLSHLHPFKKMAARPVLNYLQRWDKKSASRVTQFIANSHCVAERIRNHYGQEARVIYPPVDTHHFSIAKQREDYYITCSRLVPYKRVDLLVQAFAKLPDQKLLIVGTGPEMRKLKNRATRNIEFLGYKEDAEMRELVAKAKAFVFAAEEDFGIVTVEAQAAGVPVIAYGKGGSTETVLPAQTGIFFQEQTSDSVMSAIQRFEKMQDDFEPEKIKAHAEKFSKIRFLEEMEKVLETLTT